MRINLSDLKLVAEEIIEKIFEIKEKQALKDGQVGEMGPAVDFRRLEKNSVEKNEG